MKTIDTTGIKSNLITIFNVLRNQQTEVSRFRKEYSQWITNDQYNSDYVSKKVDEITKNLEAYAMQNLKDLEKYLDDILIDCQANAKVFTIDDPKLQASIQLINTVGKDMNYDTADNIVHTFIGDQQALTMIKAMFKAKEIDTKEVEKYIFNAEYRINDMKELLYPLTHQVKDSMIFLVKLTRSLKDFAALNGIELTEQESNIGIDWEAYHLEQAKSVMGLL